MSGIKISFLGDIYVGNKDINLLDKDMQMIIAKLRQSDYCIGNLEAPICKESSSPITKTGPNLKVDDSVVDFLNALGVNAVTLANNHIGDYGESGVENTIDVLTSNNIAFVGAGRTLEKAYSVLCINLSGVSLAFISVCENEFGIAGYQTAGAAGYRIDLLINAINRAKERAEYIIVLFHGGNEYYPLPNPDVQQRYRAIIDMGANIVVGTHTHCPQGFEYYHNGIICYSLGNFIFPSNVARNPMASWFMGYWADFIIDISGQIHLEVVPYCYYNHSIRLFDNSDYKIFMNYMRELNNIIEDEEKISQYFSAWARHKGDNYAKRLLWDENICDKYTYEIQNIFRCESHCSLLKNYYENLLTKEDNITWEKLKSLLQIRVDKKKFSEGIIKVYRFHTVLNIDNILSFVNGSTVYICGAGKVGKSVYSYLCNMDLEIIFLDRNGNKGEYIGDAPIEDYNYLYRQGNMENLNFIVAVAKRDMQKTIIADLTENGVNENQIICTVVKLD